MDLSISCPFTMLVCGASGSGKTVFTQRLLANQDLLKGAPKRVVWCYGAAGMTLSSAHELHQGLLSEELLN
jgi:septin family protein